MGEQQRTPQLGAPLCILKLLANSSQQEDIYYRSHWRLESYSPSAGFTARVGILREPVCSPI